MVRRIVPALVLVAAASLSGNAVSQTAPSRQTHPPALEARVVALENRVRELEQRAEACENGAVRPQSDGSYDLSLNGAHVVIDHKGTVSVTPIKSPSSDAVDACSPPYNLDPTGIRVPKLACASTQPCDPPYTVDTEGVRRVKNECL